MATRLYLVRHGATELSAEDRFAGATDVLLSPEGEHQARCLSGRLAQNRIDAVYASPRPMRERRATSNAAARKRSWAAP